jgi:hypothetical protein
MNARDELAKIVHKALGDVTGIHDTSDKEDREIADAILAAGYSKDSAAKFVLRERERELLELKGPCRAPGCVLHYAHNGPCNVKTEATA